jgi:hypothetical protein
MTSRSVILLKPQSRPLVRAVMDAYLDWLDQCDAVWSSYRRWVDASEADAGGAFQHYGAALDREEHASEIYAALIRDAGEPLATAASLSRDPNAPAPERHESRRGPRT